MTEEKPAGQRFLSSLRLRFLLAIGLWVALGIGGIWFSATSLFSAHVEAQYHDELKVHVLELARLTRIGPDGQPVLNRPLSDPRYEVPLSGFYWQVTVPGKASLRSESLTQGHLDENVAHAPEVVHQVDSGPTGPVIAYGLLKHAPGGEEVHFVVATDQSELNRAIHRFTRQLTFWLVGLGALLLATGIAIISFGMRPLDRLGTAIASLRAGKTAKLEGRYPSEIAPLVSDLNAYVQANADMIAHARVQAGNLAHSLRTPLAVVMDEAEVLAGNGTAPVSANVLLDQAKLMEQQIEYQLARARSGVRGRIPGARSPLPDLVSPILQAMCRIHPEKQFEMIDELPVGTVLPADPVNLTELLSILLDNAGKWARSKVSVKLDRGEEGTRIVIQDDGPGMSAEQIEKAFEVGTRFSPDMPGSGLGLAIAADLCEALSARLELARSPAGFQAILTI